MPVDTGFVVCLLCDKACCGCVSSPTACPLGVANTNCLLFVCLFTTGKTCSLIAKMLAHFCNLNLQLLSLSGSTKICNYCLPYS